MMLVVAGDVDPPHIIALAEKLCGAWKPSAETIERTVPQIHGGVDRLRVDRFKQQVLALTFPSVSASDPLAETVDAAASILGGENSRFFWNIVQAGLSPRAGVFHLDYTDCGVLILSGACQPELCEPLHEAMRKEADRICREPVQPHEVDRVKNKRRTALAVEAEAPYHRLTQIMDDMEHRGFPRTVSQMLADVDAVTAEGILDYFGRCPIHTAGHLTSVGPRDWPEANERVFQTHSPPGGED
jgi:predicted Zn-dependent peptidase